MVKERLMLPRKKKKNNKKEEHYRSDHNCTAKSQENRKQNAIQKANDNLESKIWFEMHMGKLLRRP
jgi:hypothetical protein